MPPTHLFSGTNVFGTRVLSGIERPTGSLVLDSPQLAVVKVHSTVLTATPALLSSIPVVPKRAQCEGTPRLQLELRCSTAS